MNHFDGPEILPDVTVDSFGSFLDTIAQRNRGVCLFRGHRDETWPLEPNIFRYMYRKKHIANGLPLMLLDSFKKSAVRLVQPPPSNDWEWLAVAQHHGLITPLLDWTTNPLAAAFFAVEDPLRESECAGQAQTRAISAVWCYWPRQDHLGWLSDYYDPETSPFEAEKVLMFEPSHFSSRIPAQGAVFTVHPFAKGGLAKPKWNGSALKIKIPAGVRVDIRRSLMQFGIHHASLFPDVDGLAKYINARFKVADDEELRRKRAI